MKKIELIMAAMMFFDIAATAQSTSVEKLSPWLAASVEAIAPGAHARMASPEGASAVKTSETPYIDVLLKLAPDADESALLQRHGAALRSRIGRVLVVRMPTTQVLPLADDPQVVRIEAERMPRPLLNMVPAQIGADRASATDSSLPQAFTGKGVVVGIVDSGFDFIHPFFRDADGKTRIAWAADYMNGKTYTTTEAVTNAMHSSDATKMYHGTHVAAIAAGSRVEDADWDKPTAYRGIATEADIAEGAINSEITATGLSSATSVQAFSDIFAYASEQGKPCVINYSLGDAMSFVDNRQLEEEAISTLLQTPGRALVVASGNAGDTKRLAHKPAETARGGCGVCFNDYEQYGTFFGVELKLADNQTVTLRYTDGGYQTNKGSKTVTTAELAQGTSFKLGTKQISAQTKGKSTDGYNVVYLTAGLTTTFLTSERILITIEGEGDAWIYADPLCAQLENIAAIEGHSLAADGYSVAWPAMMPQVVTVGNVAHRFQIVTMANKYSSQGGVVTPTDLTDMESTKGEGYLARSSSVGPTLTGAIKPDVCAPGVNIVSAQNFFIDDDTYYALAAWDIAALDTDYETWGSLSGYFHIMAQTGTSMSAPAVTGAIALWMQADPTLTTEGIKDIIAHSSRQPDSELTYPNNQYGYGEIDVYQGLLYMLGLTAIKDLSQHQPARAAIRLDGRQLHISFADGCTPGKCTVSIYSTDGRLLLTKAGSTTGTQAATVAISLDSLPQGVYAVQVNTADKQTTGSTLIRL